MADSVTVIVPTIGRPTLRATLDSIPPDWKTVVVADGVDAMVKAHRIVNGDATLTWTTVTEDVGHSQRNKGMTFAKTDWLAFMDDDDTYAPNVQVDLDERVPHIFQMRYPGGRTLWTEPLVRHGMVGTPMFIVPNDPERLGRWPSHRSGDFDFIRDTCGMYDQPPRFVEQVIALVRPHEA